MDENHSAGSEIQRPQYGRRSRPGTELSTLETDAYVRCYALLVVLARNDDDDDIENNKSYKRWYCPHRTECVSMCCWIISPFLPNQTHARSESATEWQIDKSPRLSSSVMSASATRPDSCWIMLRRATVCDGFRKKNITSDWKLWSAQPHTHTQRENVRFTDVYTRKKSLV